MNVNQFYLPLIIKEGTINIDTMKITIWGDFACPFCYMGEYMLESLIEERAEAGESVPELLMRAYQLDPDAPVEPEETMEEHFCSSHGVSPEQAREQMDRIIKLAKRAGLDYNLYGVKVCSTFDAHRLMKLAADITDSETVRKLNFALFHANFIENRQLSDHAVLKEIAGSVGLDASQVEDVLLSDRYADAVRADEKEADESDLEYIPYLRFEDGRVLQGVLSRGALRDALNHFD